MKIFKDVFTGDELFSDTYKIVLKDEVLYEVWGKVKIRFSLCTLSKECRISLIVRTRANLK